MSSTNFHPAAVGSRPRRRLRWVIAGVVAVVAVGVGLYAYFAYTNEQELLEAVAEADRLDPGWRLADMEAARRPVPAGKNGADVVLAARALLPKPWLPIPPGGAPSIEDRLTNLGPRERPAAADLQILRTELAITNPWSCFGRGASTGRITK